MSESEDITSCASVQTYPDSSSSENYSRSSQQVPRIFENFNGHNIDENAYHHSVPFLNITEQPADSFRFRYKSEMVGKHGCLLGEKSKKGRDKCYPGVELCNYSGRAKIRCSLAQVNGEKLPHPHRLLVDVKDEDVVQVVDAHKGYRVVFSGMGIILTAKKYVAKELFARTKSQLKFMEPEKWNMHDEYELKSKCEEKAKTINLNQVCLCFSAYRIEDDKPICNPVYTVAINNLKSALTNELKIVRISKVKGKCKGGDDVFIFVKRVIKKNIKVRFFELEDYDTRLWEAYGTFNLSDVHYQYGIVFQTPPYKDMNLSKSKDVWVELVRPSDGKVSEAVKFTYQADPSAAHAPGKRRRAQMSTSLSSLGSSGGSLKSVDLSTTLQTAMKRTKDVMEEPMGIYTMMSNITSANDQTHKAMLGDALMDKFDTSTLLSSSATLFTEMDVVKVDAETDVGAGDFANSGELNSSAIINQVLLQGGADSSEYRNFLHNCTESYMEIFTQGSSGLLQMDGVGVRKDNQRTGMSGATVRGDVGVRHPLAETVTYNNDEQFCETLEPEVKIEEDSCSEGGGEYTATFNAADGERVKQLVSELQGLLTRQCHKSTMFRKMEELMDIKLSNGDSFVHMAITNNILDAVTLVVMLLVKLDLTEKLNLQNSHGNTVLHSAVLCDQPEIIPLLIQAGCNPNIEDTDGNTPVHHAITYARNECLNKLLATYKTNNIPEYKINFNAINSDGHSALHLCAATSSVSGAAALLGRGADVNVADPSGRTPLHLATKAALQDAAEISEAYKVVVILLQSKADVDAVDKDGNTALRIACHDSKSYDIIKLLLEKGADPMKALLVTDNVYQDDDDDDDDDVSQEHCNTSDYTGTLVKVLHDMGKVETANMVFEKYFKE